MLAAIKVWVKKVDWLLMLNVFFLILFSLAALYSLDIKEEFNSSNLFIRQVIFVVSGFIIAMIISLFDYRWLKNYYKIILFITLTLLLVVLFFAEPIRGMTGWLEIGGQTFQPSELAKLALIVFLAKYLSDHSKEFYQFKHIAITGVVMVVIVLLVASQPDFGSAAIIFATWFIMLLFTKIPRQYVISLLLSFIILAILLWSFVLADYQQSRLISFLSPQADILGQGYNVQQSIIAVGSGQLLGRGLGLGPQSQLNFLPEQYSDFIFAVIAEGLGLWGAILLLVLFLVFFIRLIGVIKNSGNAFASWMVLGFVVYLCLQVIINIAMNIGLAPITGITLPFISYGGSSLLISFITLGIIQSVIVKRREKLFTN